MPQIDLTDVEIGMLILCIDTALDIIDYNEAERNRGLELRTKLERCLH